MPFEMVIPHDLAQQLLNECQPKIDAALSVAKDIQKIVAHYAIIENQDVNGDQMAHKKPRPKASPTNYPNIPLVQNDTPDLMDPKRWAATQINAEEAVAIFDPPDHLEYLMEKDPEKGGRRYIDYENINPNARAKIQNEMSKRGNEA